MRGIPLCWSSTLRTRSSVSGSVEISSPRRSPYASRFPRSTGDCPDGSPTQLQSGFACVRQAHVALHWSLSFFGERSEALDLGQPPRRGTQTGPRAKEGSLTGCRKGPTGVGESLIGLDPPTQPSRLRRLPSPSRRRLRRSSPVRVLDGGSIHGRRGPLRWDLRRTLRYAASNHPS